MGVLEKMRSAYFETLKINPHKVQFRVKEEKGNWECRWLPQIKISVLSRWRNFTLLDNGAISYSDHRFCSLESAKKYCRKAKQCIINCHKGSEGDKARRYYNVN